MLNTGALFMQAKRYLPPYNGVPSMCLFKCALIFNFVLTYHVLVNNVNNKIQYNLLYSEQK